MNRKTKNIIPDVSTILRTILVIVMLMTFCTADARKKQPSKHEQKRYNISVVDEINPDPVSRKTKPDRLPRAIEEPDISGFGSTGGSQLHGIDVSHYQGNIDWKQVASDPKVGYVFIKASEGANIQDDYYLSNVREARRAGIKVGSYHFFRANVSPEVQLKNFMSMMDVKNQDILPIIDVEATNGVNSSLFHDRLKSFLKLVTKELGRRPLIYTGRNFYNKHFYGMGYDDYKFMIACYTFDEPTLKGGDDFIMWQYTASGRIRGIRGNVDQSKFVGRHALREIILK